MSEQRIPNPEQLPGTISVTDGMREAVDQVLSDRVYNGDIEGRRSGARGLIALGKATLEAINAAINQEEVDKAIEGSGAKTPEEVHAARRAIEIYAKIATKEEK